MSDTVEWSRESMMNNKKGSSAVFLTVILATLMTLTLALIYGVKAQAVRSSMDAIISLAGDSVLSEYDRKLQEEYGLFLVKGDDEELTEKLHRYVSYSVDDMENVEIQSVKVSSSRYSVIGISMIREQIIEHMRILKAEGLLKDNEKNPGGTIGINRSLNHGPTIVSLPSANIPSKELTAVAESIADKLSEVDKAFEVGTESYLINSYITEHFNSRGYMKSEDHFFCNEVEYILGGELSDRKNEKRVEMALKAMRFPINLAYLYSDAEKQATLAAAAQLMTPGAAAAATQAALASTWAYAEADNDVKLLWEGHSVPMVKDDSSWAIDLDSAIEGVFGGGIAPQEEKGYDYNEYLKILLFFQDENIKLARILDLIQINMRANYDGGFLISEYSSGVTVEVKANGRTYRHEKKY